MRSSNVHAADTEEAYTPLNEDDDDDLSEKLQQLQCQTKQDITQSTTITKNSLCKHHETASSACDANQCTMDHNTVDSVSSTNASAKANDATVKRKASNKKRKRGKKSRRKRGGVKSLPIKVLTHPLDRSIAFVFFVTLFFTLLAIVSGLPVVALLCCLLPLGLFTKRFLSCQWRRLPSSVKALTSIENYWLYGPAKNNNKFGTSLCMLYLDKEFRINQLRDVILTRVIQKPEYVRFRSQLVFKGVSQTPFWVRVPFEKFHIEDHVIDDDTIRSNVHLKSRLLELTAAPLPKKRPLWQIHWCFASHLNQIVLILRVHQSLCDGIGLLSMLVEQLADQAPPPTTTFIRTCQGTMTATTALFKPRFGGINFAVNICRAVIVGPLTFFLWLWWAFSRRKNNYLKSFRYYRKIRGQQRVGNSRANSVSHSSTSKHSASVATCEPLKSIYWTSLDLPQVNRVKQVTRSCLNDVIMAAISGSIRDYLVTKSGIENPPDLTISIPVDIRGINEGDTENAGVNYVLLTSPLPTITEGAIPRLWEIRHLMEELKTSADPAVMYGAHYFLNSLIPSSLARFLLNLVHRNSSVCLSNLQGPDMELTIGTHRLRKIIFWMSPPPNVPISFNIVSYNHRLYYSISTTSQLIPCAKTLAKLFKYQLEQFSDLLSRRRVPGESRHKKRPHHVIIEAPIGGGGGMGMSMSSLQPLTTTELTERLRQVQFDLNQLNDALDRGVHDRGEIAERLDELKEEFSELMKQIRRRKSVAEHPSIVINLEEEDDEIDDMEGGLRPPMRRFSLASRRGSVVSAISLGAGAVGKRFSVTPPMSTLSRHATSSPEPSSSPDRDRYREESLV